MRGNYILELKLKKDDEVVDCIRSNNPEIIEQALGKMDRTMRDMGAREYINNFMSKHYEDTAHIEMQHIIKQSLL